MFLVEKDFSRLPSVDKVLSDKRIEQVGKEYPHDLVVEIIRQRLERERRAIAEGKASVSLDAIIETIISQLQALEKPSLRPEALITGRRLGISRACK